MRPAEVEVGFDQLTKLLLQNVDIPLCAVGDLVLDDSEGKPFALVQVTDTDSGNFRQAEFQCSGDARFAADDRVVGSESTPAR